MTLLLVMAGAVAGAGAACEEAAAARTTASNSSARRDAVRSNMVKLQVEKERERERIVRERVGSSSTSLFLSYTRRRPRETPAERTLSRSLLFYLSVVVLLLFFFSLFLSFSLSSPFFSAAEKSYLKKTFFTTCPHSPGRTRKQQQR